jgi:hypothetical protein
MALPLKNAIPFRVHPMLATLVRKPFDKKGWIYEEKYDGYRILAYKEGDQIKLMSRNDIDRTEHFSQIATAVKALKAGTLPSMVRPSWSIAKASLIFSSCSKTTRMRIMRYLTASTVMAKTCGGSRFLPVEQ